MRLKLRRLTGLKNIEYNGIHKYPRNTKVFTIEPDKYIVITS